MSIADTLVDISHESALNKAERMSLRRIAIEYEELQAENAKLRGEEPIPFAWWAECPKLAQRTMERIIDSNAKLRKAIKLLEGCVVQKRRTQITEQALKGTD